MSEIIVNHNVKKRIKEDLNTSYPTIRKALYGKTTTPLALKIRTKALELGGAKVKPAK